MLSSGLERSLGAVGLVSRIAQSVPGASATLEVLGKSQETAYIEKDLGGVELRFDAELRCDIIIRVLVVPVVPTLTNSNESHNGILSRHGGGFIRMIAVEVSTRVDIPGAVEDETVAESTSNPETIPEAFAPLHSHDSREDEAHEKSEPRVKSVLENDNRISLKIEVVQLLSRLLHSLVLLDEQPSHVREEESAKGIMRIGGSIREFVVDTVVSGPMEDRSLVSNRVDEHEEYSEGQDSLIGAMRPQAMRTSGDSQASNRPEQISPEEGVFLALGDHENSDDCSQVNQTHVDDHGPVQVLLLIVLVPSMNGIGDKSDWIHFGWPFSKICEGNQL